MKFYIKKTSDGCIIWDDDDQAKPPCGGCNKLETVFEHDNCEEYRWQIEVNTIEELLKIAPNGKVIVSRDTIEIYDRYRE